MKEAKQILAELYDPKSFNEKGHKVVDLLTQYLKDHLEDSDKATIPYSSPEDSLSFWRSYNGQDALSVFSAFLDNSIRVHDRRYMGHQVVSPAPDAALAAFFSQMLNNGGAVYEMGMASNTLEKVVIERMLPYFGFDENGGGLMTSGGTLANLTALLCARAVKGESVWQHGTSESYAFMVSAEAHYCIDRAVRVMGWGDAGIIKVPVDSEYRMRTDLLETYYAAAINSGIKVIGIVGSAPTTSTGNYDDLESIGAFAMKNNLWYHIDGAHGGPAVFSEKYKYLMKGCHMADSITIDGHKNMMIPSLTTMLLFKEAQKSYLTFNQEAQYLWSSEQYEWSNAGKRTFECTKLVMSLRFYVIMQQYGMDAFSAYIDTCYDLSKQMAALVLEDDRFEIGVQPDSNILCFRPIKSRDLQAITEIRRQLINDGDYYIVQTMLNGQAFLRVSLMNPFTTLDDIQGMLDAVWRYADL